MEEFTIKNFKEQFPKNDIIWQYSDPIQVQKMAFEYLGPTAVIYRSWNKNKKYVIYNPHNQKFIHFGQIPYEDFTKHKNLKRRKNYLTRTANMKGDWESNPYSANNLSRNILW